MKNTNTKDIGSLSSRILAIVRAVLTAIICLTIAFVIWSFSINESTNSYSRTFTINRLSVNGTGILAERRGLSVTEAPQISLEVTVSGLRKDVIKLTAEDFAAYIDVSTLETTGAHTVEISVNPPSAVKVESVTPSTIDVQIDEIKTVEVEVVPKLAAYSMDVSYSFGELTSDTKTVAITGPASVVDRILFVKAEITLAQVTTSMQSMSKLVAMVSNNSALEEQYLNSVSFSVSGVNVRIPVYTDAEIPLGYTYAPGESGEKIRSVTFSRPSVVLRGDPKLMRGISVLNVLSVGEDTPGTVTFTLAQLLLPEGVTLVTPDEIVTVTVERRTAPPESSGPEESSAEPTETEPLPPEQTETGTAGTETESGPGFDWP